MLKMSFEVTVQKMYLRSLDLSTRRRSTVHSRRHWGPGNRSWTQVVYQQAGFPSQMLSEGFWAATHLPLHSLSSLTSEQLWVSIDSCQDDMR